MLSHSSMSDGNLGDGGMRNCLPMWDCCSGLYKLFLFMVILICMYWIVLRLSFGKDVVEHDPMNRIVIKIPGLENCCSWWPISHFIFFFIIGIIYPNCGLIAMAGGAIWELIELFLSALTAQERQPARHKGRSQVEYSQNWWAGSFKDLLMNAAGFYSAKLLVWIYHKYKKTPQPQCRA